MQNLDEYISCEVSIIDHLEAFQVLHSSLILTVERPRADMRSHARFLPRRPLELSMNGKIGQWTFCSWEGQSCESLKNGCFATGLISNDDYLK